MSGKSVLRRIDWLTVLFYVLLVFIGWVNIYSSTFSEDQPSILDFSQLYGKQIFFMGISKTDNLFLPKQRIVVYIDFGVQSNDAFLGGDDQRVDLH